MLSTFPRRGSRGRVLSLISTIKIQCECTSCQRILTTPDWPDWQCCLDDWLRRCRADVAVRDADGWGDPDDWGRATWKQPAHLLLLQLLGLLLKGCWPFPTRSVGSRSVWCRRESSLQFPSLSCGDVETSSIWSSSTVVAPKQNNALLLWQHILRLSRRSPFIIYLSTPYPQRYKHPGSSLVLQPVK